MKLPRSTNEKREFRPVILNPVKKKDVQMLQRILQKSARVVDDYEEQLREYFATQHPARALQPNFDHVFFEYKKKIESRAPLWKQGRWVYFPWLDTIVHLLEEHRFFIVRTARNQHLITREEQKRFYQTAIGVAGLSVGNSIARAIVLQGGGGRLTLADHDALALSNLNRIQAGVQYLGKKKAEMTAQQIYELNPYARLKIFSDGLTLQNVKQFMQGLDLVVDEMDNLAMKYKIREEARRRKIPVLMGVDNGDGVVIDIERYDQNSQTRFFHGRMGAVSYQSLVGLDKLGIGRKITQHVGIENLSSRMRKSLLEIGKTIVSWPQLGGAALLNGAAMAYCVRRIVNRAPIKSGRVLFSFDEVCVPYRHRPKIKFYDTKRFKKQFGI